ncbi:MAG: hypothetical protein JJD97_04785 [Gemmatimonadaceae bacterium]|nr:hypothetical protein [Gemmatimonadaceae bacterium]
MCTESELPPIKHGLVTTREDTMTHIVPISARHGFARALIAAALGASLVMASACGSSTLTGPTDVPGTYSLHTVDGLTPPVTVPNPRTHAIVINSVTATLNGNNTYAVAGTGTEDGNASTVITDAGTYSQSGSTLHFTSTTFSGATYSATAKTDTMTVTLPGGFVDSDNTSFALLFVKGS